ncbi:hypothetical protein YTPLAS18_30090 [Nitrospira sp.]|nr:hypothetical protein YTPLAS18_30090 [Nitrospira sp.]
MSLPAFAMAETDASEVDALLVADPTCSLEATRQSENSGRCAQHQRIMARLVRLTTRQPTEFHEHCPATVD